MVEILQDVHAPLVNTPFDRDLVSPLQQLRPAESRVEALLDVGGSLNDLHMVTK